jgi:hypothetical protein
LELIVGFIFIEESAGLSVATMTHHASSLTRRESLFAQQSSMQRSRKGSRLGEHGRGASTAHLQFFEPCCCVIYLSIMGSPFIHLFAPAAPSPPLVFFSNEQLTLQFIAHAGIQITRSHHLIAHIKQQQCPAAAQANLPRR